MILDNFIEDLRDAIYGDAIVFPSHLVIGTGTTPPVATDTTLETEVLRATCTNSKTSNHTVGFSKTWGITEGNGNTFSEIGALNASSGGTLANRMVFPPFEKTNQFELRVQVYIKSENS